MRETVVAGKDGVFRRAKLKASKGIIERPVQHLYHMKLKVDGNKKIQNNPTKKGLNPEVEVFKPKQQRKALKGMAVDRIKGLALDSSDDMMTFKHLS